MEQVRVKRFAGITEEDVSLKWKALKSSSSTRCESHAWRCFADCLKENSFPMVTVADFDCSEDQEIDKLLSRFFLAARGGNGEHYKSNTLSSLRYGLARVFKEHRGLDIIHGESFVTSGEAFRTAEKELKVMGKGATTHHDEITQAGK